jgi:hypothetical protein
MHAKLFSIRYFINSYAHKYIMKKVSSTTHKLQRYQTSWHHAERHNGKMSTNPIPRPMDTCSMYRGGRRPRPLFPSPLASGRGREGEQRWADGKRSRTGEREGVEIKGKINDPSLHACYQSICLSIVQE